MKRTICALAFSALLLPGSMFGASKEQQEMQRDIAQLQDQVRTLQSTVDQKMATLQTLVEQALDAGNKANMNVSVLNSSVRDTLDRELKDALRPVAGLSAKIDNLGNDSSEVKNSLADLANQMNTVVRKLNDIDNAIKVLQAPPAAPPPSSPGFDTGGAQTRNGPPPPASVMYGNGMNDYSSGKSDLAAGEFADFVRAYPDDPSAPRAEIYIGQIHLSQMKYDQAVTDFDAVLERYPESKDTVDAYFLKGMALKSLKQPDAAADQFRTVARKYPHSDRAAQAKEQLSAMGLSVGPATTARKKK